MAIIKPPTANLSRNKNFVILVGIVGVVVKNEVKVVFGSRLTALLLTFPFYHKPMQKQAFSCTMLYH